MRGMCPESQAEAWQSAPGRSLVRAAAPPAPAFPRGRRIYPTRLLHATTWSPPERGSQLPTHRVPVGPQASPERRPKGA